ncbi:hypothetical protein ACPXAO_24835, partial [Salmonella enterica]|uniref:hypothetical protein n=1 Tax=Salmonella enterica TaxID=28901 RepID=UPI003CF756D4
GLFQTDQQPRPHLTERALGVLQIRTLAAIDGTIEGLCDRWTGGDAPPVMSLSLSVRFQPTAAEP